VGRKHFSLVKFSSCQIRLSPEMLQVGIIDCKLFYILSFVVDGCKSI
jgi:hypothetical protein